MAQVESLERGWAAAAVFWLAAVPGCATSHHSVNRAGVQDSGVEGQVAFQFVPDPARVRPSLTDRQVFMPPRPLETPLPIYPESELHKNTGPVTVVVRIFVGTDGSVDQVFDSPLGGSTQIDTGDPFRSSVEQAVRGWRFASGQVRTLAESEGSDGERKPDFRVIADETPVRTYLDLRFTFEVIDGKGRVRSE
jgi:hypothetical protein